MFTHHSNFLEGIKGEFYVHNKTRKQGTRKEVKLEKHKENNFHAAPTTSVALTFI